MRRRALIATIAGPAVWSAGARAQQAAKVPRLGILVTGFAASAGVNPGLIEDIRQPLRALGYIEGQNIIIEFRTAEGRIERLPELARELVAIKVDLIVAAGTPAGLAAQQATRTIPIVVPLMGDPVGDGLVASLARPGGNVTGTTFLGPELIPKRLAILKELLPTMSHLAVLWHPGAFGERTMKDMLKEAAGAAATLGLQLQFAEVRGPDEIDRAFTAIVGTRAEAVFQFPSTMIYTERKRVVDLAAAYRLPAMYNERQFVIFGGLIGYGTNLVELTRLSATYVDRILKGAKPSDLPVEQPTNFELVINMKTAKTLGLSIPPSILARADEVIE